MRNRGKLDLREEVRILTAQEVSAMSKEELREELKHITSEITFWLRSMKLANIDAKYSLEKRKEMMRNPPEVFNYVEDLENGIWLHALNRKITGLRKNYDLLNTLLKTKQ